VRPTRHESFEGLFRENYAAVRAYALRRASREAAQDVVAETFLVAWRRLDDVPADALPWLYAVARRVLANQRRSANRGAALERRLAGAATPRGAPDPGDTLGDNELMRLALARLPEHSREALMLVAWQEPIACGGVAVFPDDIIVADADGVIVLPSALAAEVAAAGLEQERLDEWQMEQIKRGVSLSALAPMPKDK